MPARPPADGILLVGHGTASEVGTAQFLKLAAQLAEQLAPLPVEPAFLEMRQPDIAQGIAKLMDLGATSLAVAPLLLFAAGHAKRDIPRAVASAIGNLRGPPIRSVLVQHLGCHPALVELSRQRFDETIVSGGRTSPLVTGLVLVGRGSADPDATAEMQQFGRLRHPGGSVVETLVGFVAMAKPSLDEVLEVAVERRFSRVIVQPHLLFEGEIAATIRAKVAAAARAHSDQQWLVTPLLADPQDSRGSGNQYLLRALAERIRAATDQ